MVDGVPPPINMDSKPLLPILNLSNSNSKLLSRRRRY